MSTDPSQYTIWRDIAKTSLRVLTSLRVKVKPSLCPVGLRVGDALEHLKTLEFYKKAVSRQMFPDLNKVPLKSSYVLGAGYQ